MLLGFVSLLCLMEHHTPRRMKSGIVIGMMVSMFLNIGRIGAAEDAKEASMRAGGGGGFGMARAAPGETFIFADHRRRLMEWWG